jgi:hypothetical protein
MLTMGLVKTPEQMQQVIDTGRLDPITRASHEEYLLILRENEMLARGEPPPTMLGDKHLLHGAEHTVVIANPAARQNPAVVQALHAHLVEHYSLLFNVPPELVEQDPLYHDRMLILQGQQPPRRWPRPGARRLPRGPGADPNAPPPKQGGPPGGPVPAGGDGGPGDAPEDPVKIPAAEGTSLEKKLPSQPVQPLTGHRWDPASGGGQVPAPNK